MTRLFGRGELQEALLHVALELGPSNGYAIMHALAARVGGSWRPSPGAVYPALLGLEDAGLLEGRDEEGGRLYSVTPAGRAKVLAAPDVVRAVAERAEQAPPASITVGALLDRLSAEAPARSLALGPRQVRRIESLFQPLLVELQHLTAEEAP